MIRTSDKPVWIFAVRLMKAVFLCWLVMTIGCAGREVITPEPAARVVYSKGVSGQDLWPDEKLYEAFSRYWALRYQGNSVKSLEMEAPYFQETVPKQRYYDYAANYAMNDLDEVEIYSLTMITEHLAELGCYFRISAEGGRNHQLAAMDVWVKAGGRWYHVLKEPLFFPDI